MHQAYDVLSFLNFQDPNLIWIAWMHIYEGAGEIYIPESLPSTLEQINAA